MAFDLNLEEVKELREKYQGVNPTAKEVASTASYIQNEYLPESAGIGNLTTIEGAQSTKTRRPLSASVDLIVDNENGLEELGESYKSWSHGGGYFADIDDLEVGIIHTENFPVWDFPEEALENRYSTEVVEFDVVLAEPSSNATSKFNRMVNGEVVKDSDAIDMGSHLHWARNTDITSVRSIADRVEEYIEGSYEEACRSIRNAEHNFSKDERESLKGAVTEFSELLGIEYE